MASSDDARKAVTSAIANAGSKSVGMMVGAAMSSKDKRDENRKARDANTQPSTQTSTSNTSSAGTEQKNTG
ncbi:hypothetical protein NUU61_003550 [Penicillium alfredii]|uniref:Uncharacterized protein n=1 Tax=Penicillium alfredii TaxID=1506179 RepID=A0A9W9FJM1_9EURO|nr:uncharacterized protein NUU61_003550 [Penicillium alfredii]KAJ5101328.1 hypothetical protein NUU61_003550 [Penicillium alfredii]